MAKKRIEDIDKNFKNSEIGGKMLKFKKAQEKPFAEPEKQRRRPHKGPYGASSPVV